MRAVVIGMALVTMVTATAWAASPLVAELQALSTRYHENPKKIDRLKAALEKAAESDPDSDTFLALAQVCFMYGDVRATTEEAKLAAYDCGRRAAKRAIELAPKSAPAQFWYGTNTGRWGETKGIMRALFLLPTVKEAMQTARASGFIFFILPGKVTCYPSARASRPPDSPPPDRCPNCSSRT